MFTHEGGVDAGDVDEKAEKLLILVGLFLNDKVVATLSQLSPLSKRSRDLLFSLSALYKISRSIIRSPLSKRSRDILFTLSALSAL